MEERLYGRQQSYSVFVMDPLGNIPVVLSVLKDIEPRRRRIIIVRELLIALAILLLFLFGGQRFLDVLHLQQESVTIAGGIVLLIIGLRMIFPQREGVMGAQIDGEPFIVPIAVPMIAGPSALATLILNEERQTTNDKRRMTNTHMRQIDASQEYHSGSARYPRSMWRSKKFF